MELDTVTKAPFVRRFSKALAGGFASGVTAATTVLFAGDAGGPEALLYAAVFAFLGGLATAFAPKNAE